MDFEIRKLYYEDDADILGRLLEFSDHYAEEIYNTNISRELFVSIFMHSKIRKLMDECHPKLLSQSAHDTFRDFVQFDLGGDLSSLIGTTEDNFCENELLWIGEMYAYVRCVTGLSGAQIFDSMPLNVARHYYVTGHELSFSKAFERIKGLFEHKAQV